METHIISDNQVLNCKLSIFLGNMEIWKDIKHYEGYYQISNLGRVKNTKTNYILMLSDKNSLGYKRVTLYNPVRKRFFVHRLVAYHFCDGYRDGLVVNHIDGNKENNCAENLEWVTRSENDLHAFNMNLRKIEGAARIQKERAKRGVDIFDIRSGDLIYEFDNVDKCAEYFGMNRTYIQQCCRGMYILKRRYRAKYREIA